ncbi:MAG: alpha-amylase family glycosyl hydrolase [Cytophagales bacterium]|nr:alpha-amylase family glycosyl hydrolase [Cytophagales bacterium]
MKFKLLALTLLLTAYACNTPKTQVEEKPAEAAQAAEANFMWENANMYFLLTDRFKNGDPSNDNSFGRQPDGAPLRSFMGGDIRGVIQKLDEGYFQELGVNAIWMTPVFQQVKSSVDEGYGSQYAFHGYWISDWTTLDPNFGTIEDLKELIKKAHNQGIRIVFDVVINHTGPVTEMDPKYEESWVRTSPQCTYSSYASTVTCTLVENLPDVRTESDEAVELPRYLVDKWKAEGRYEQEVAELDAFFEATGHPRAPRFYIMKWITDYIKELGIDGLRVDTVKHVEETVWKELYQLALQALKDWKTANPAEKLDDLDLYYLGEVYNYSIYNKEFTMDGGVEKIDYYAQGFNSLINFAFKGEVVKKPEEVFSTYSNILNSPEWEGLTTLHYIASHDDGAILDRSREQIKDFATMLMLVPGGAQIYYGDELGRKLEYEGASGDATLRTPMPWEELETNETMQATLAHWQKLGKFRRDHPSIGAGVHEMIQAAPYTFKRTLSDEVTDQVVVVMDPTSEVNVANTFPEGQEVKDHYSGAIGIVKDGKVTFNQDSPIRLVAL